MSEDGLAIASLVRHYLDVYRALSEPPFVLGKTRIPLSVPTFGSDEVIEAIRSLLELRVTMGSKVQQFERMFADYIGVRNAVMVNSGSSANLLALSVLRYSGRLQPGDEVITPAVTWSTTVFPIIQVGCVPVFVDVDLGTYTANVNEIEKAITKKTKAIMPVHLLGNPCNMREITWLAESKELYLIEDCCEAIGAEWERRRVGSFGHFASFSTFFSHHISTGEGGMVVTNNDFADMARSMRAHGWIRERSDRDWRAGKHPNIDPRFLFETVGYNFRPTELAGAFGIHQIGKLEGFIKRRQENAEYWNRELDQFYSYFELPIVRMNTRHVWFGYPLTVKPTAPFKRAELTAYLEAAGIETRPIMAGNMVEQPCMAGQNYRVVGDLKNAKLIQDAGFFWGDHAGIGPPEREYIAATVKRFIEAKT